MPSRLPFIDALKALAAQLIVLHHLAFYGPMSDHAHALAPDLISWFSQDARYAVQVFLVLGGFLAVQSLAPAGHLRVTEPLGVLWKRCCKLAGPYLVALLVALLGAAIGRALMVHDSLPGPPTLSQVLAHVFLLQSILGHEGLSAGVWYIAIDWRLVHRHRLAAVRAAAGLAVAGTAGRGRHRPRGGRCRRPGRDAGTGVALSLQSRRGMG